MYYLEAEKEKYYLFTYDKDKNIKDKEEYEDFDKALKAYYFKEGKEELTILVNKDTYIIDKTYINSEMSYSLDSFICSLTSVAQKETNKLNDKQFFDLLIKVLYTVFAFNSLLILLLLFILFV